VLTKLHQQGLTHGAITPASIIYSTDETWLTEAGFEKQFRLNSRVSTGLPIALRSQYMSPEQLAGHIPSPQSDIYSLGIALFELVTGKFPFGGRTTTTVMASILTDESATNAASGGQEPGYVIKAILRAIEKDPADRWQSAEQFAKAFSENAVSDSAQKLSSRNVVNQSGCASRVLLLLSIVSIMLYW
jgi:serine/threonine-protein kinase